MSRRIAIVILVLATAVTLGRVCTFGFTNIEDEGLITRNAHLNPPTLAGLAWHWAHPHIGLYIPVTYTAWWMLAKVAPLHVPDESGATLNPWIFHCANLALHIINALLVMSVLRRLRLDRSAALVGALLFALHPIQVEAVAWTTGMKDVLSAAFALGAIDLYLRGTSKFGFTTYALATICFILAMLAKPAAVVVPVLLAITELLLFDRPRGAITRMLLPWFVLTLPILLITRLVQPALDVTSTPLWLRPLVAADALAFYLYKLAWPFNLTLQYGRSPTRIMQTGQIVWTWIAPMLVALLAVLSRRRRLIAAVLIFVAGALPVLGLTKFTYQQFSTVADRYVYLSMLGVALAAADVISLRPTRPALIAAAVVLALLAVRSFDQAGTWRDRLTLYRHATIAAPGSAIAHANLAAVLIQVGRQLEAEPQAARAVQLDPTNAGYRITYALILQADGRWPQLLEQLEELNRLAPTPDRAQWLQEIRAMLSRGSSPPPPASRRS